MTETFGRDAVMKGKGEVPYRGGLLLQGKEQFGPSNFPNQPRRRHRKKGKKGGKRGGKRGLLRGPAEEGGEGEEEGGM